MNPVDGVGQDGVGVHDDAQHGANPIVRRVAPGTAQGAGVQESPGLGGAHAQRGGAAVALPGPSALAAGMRLTDSERAMVNGLLPEITNRERQVLFEIVAGGTNERVAERMGVKLPTLRTHLMRLNQKLGSTSKSDLVRLVTQAIVLDYRSRLFGSMDPVMGERDEGSRD